MTTDYQIEVMQSEPEPECIVCQRLVSECICDYIMAVEYDDHLINY